MTYGQKVLAFAVLTVVVVALAEPFPNAVKFTLLLVLSSVVLAHATGITASVEGVTNALSGGAKPGG